jgi:large subunit ribosomal protein LX
MQAYRVKGNAPFGRTRQDFTIDVAAADETDAEHRILSTIGSRHKAKRMQIKIESINEIDPRISKEPLVLNTFREQIKLAGGPISSSEEE